MEAAGHSVAGAAGHGCARAGVQLQLPQKPAQPSRPQPWPRSPTSRTVSPACRAPTHLLPQLVVVALPGQLVLVLGPLGGGGGEQREHSAAGEAGGRPANNMWPQSPKKPRAPRALSARIRARTLSTEGSAGLRGCARSPQVVEGQQETQTAGGTTAPHSPLLVPRPPGAWVALQPLRPGAAASPRSASSCAPQPARGSARSSAAPRRLRTPADTQR